MARKKNVSDLILSAALTLAATKGWRSTSLADIAVEADVSLAEAYAAYPTKAAILTGLLSQTDQQVLSEGGIDDQEPVRDRLFDVLMRRFDALEPHKPAVAAILRDLPLDPSSLIVALPNFACQWRGCLKPPDYPPPASPARFESRVSLWSTSTPFVSG